ncbi:MAG: sporulation protein [Betaproteobacteria bacterium HGW-Betaproteobacteria-22]|nr:MAG: sporulation protein [Betaproteobacteria bacterium HGW-Betaproteobacteria-22]
MPPEITQDQVLSLKKRARRRLVGAIALVLLMLIILPQVLQDRVATHQQEAISIVMPEALAPKSLDATQYTPTNREGLISDDHSTASISNEAANDTEPTIESLIAEKEQQAQKSQQKSASVNQKPDQTAFMAKSDKKADTGVQKNSVESYVVQVGVYSDTANVKRLQDQLKKAGFSTFTEKTSTPKGEGIRLKVGQFGSRQAAADALTKIKEIGLQGIVISNE